MVLIFNKSRVLIHAGRFKRSFVVARATFKYTVVLTDLPFFLLIIGMTTGGFHEKVEKNDLRAQIKDRQNSVN